MNNKLVHQLLETGLLQFGLFHQSDGTMNPIRLRLDMLPSYPDLLEQVSVVALSTLTDLTMDHLLCDVGSVPLGTAISLKMRIPLVYSLGSTLAPVHDLVGAYDVGHPASLLLNVLDDVASIKKLLEKAHSVGLNIHTIWTVVNLTDVQSLQGADIQCLFHIDEIIRQLLAEQMITPQLAHSVSEFRQRPIAD